MYISSPMDPYPCCYVASKSFYLPYIYIYFLACIEILLPLHSNLSYSYSSILLPYHASRSFLFTKFLLPSPLHSKLFFPFTQLLLMHPSPFSSFSCLWPHSLHIIPSSRYIFLFPFTCAKLSEYPCLSFQLYYFFPTINFH